ncbi:leucine--tRNA ligase [Natrinema gari]|uniref:Leucine--tRNA ligase n=1 Tax=Natrinema gari JCM 14663 TaxID=1230459 RepID=L9Z1H2_9EURY|nr:leucine--tRNA ligase [Natrinema gari]ELY79512.1 leucyl-tRNA ligase [Natrinema gari JCM 14663]
MRSYDPGVIEEKWRQRWEKTGRYQSDPNDEGEGVLITVPYTYPSGGMHIGHASTYSIPDGIARYHRMKGENVLYPMGWHVTGTPIVGAVNRLKEGEEAQISTLRDTYNVPESDLESLETPMGFAQYFIENYYKTNLRALGVSIDWRREFTTHDERYQRFIQWQYQTLQDRGLLEQGLHPVKYCTSEDQPVTTHDILEGEHADFQEYTLVKFQSDDSLDEAVVPTSTLRPETVRGVTNVYVNPDVTYVHADVDSESWLVSTEAVEKLQLQERDISVTREISGEELVGTRLTNPVTNESIPVFPGEFVDPNGGTGVVMSVPAHSPDDWLELQRIQSDEEYLAEYGLDPEVVQSIDPQTVVSTEEYGEIPARDVVERNNISSVDDAKLSEVTETLYEREYHQGRLVDSYDDKYAGEVIEEVRDQLRAEYKADGIADSLYDFAEEVICRCGGKVEVAKQDSWFIRYNDETWKQKTRQAVEQLEPVPESTREQFHHAIGWLEEWPCIRNFGLGTPLPADEDFIIEPLSDSTIYPAFYTIAHRLQNIPPEALDKEFFDALFFGLDAVDDPDERALDLRQEWQYWYPVNVRLSANDLVENHLTFYLYHHAELFDKSMWPEGITIMGMGLLEGRGMSSSSGHVVLPDNAVSKYGADAVRLFLFNSSEPWQDFNWKEESVSSARDQIESFYERAMEVIEMPEGEQSLERIDRWLLSKLQDAIRETTSAMENYETRSASQTALYQMNKHLRWYRRRTDLDRPGARWTQRQVLETQLRLLAPFVPFITNELYEQLTGEPVEDASWPTVNEKFDDERAKLQEELIRDLTDDIRDIERVTDTDPDTITLALADKWKHEVFETVVAADFETNAAMEELMTTDETRKRGDAVSDLVSQFVDRFRGRDEAELALLTDINERDVYESAVEFLANEFGASVQIDGGDVPDADAEKADPFRPAVHIE